jgi:uncharacterized protein with HEPN domain
MDKVNNILEHIIGHIEAIQHAVSRFGDDYEVFLDDREYFDSVCLNIMQVGELVHHLPVEFTMEHSDIPWKAIVQMRNIVTHGYGALNPEIVWNTVAEDIPVLLDKCRSLIETNIYKNKQTSQENKRC